MARAEEIRKMALVGDYVPRKCGIATFTHDVCRSRGRAVPGHRVPGRRRERRRRRVTTTRRRSVSSGRRRTLPAYRRAADFLNFCNVDVVCLQHEYGIYGGPAGSHVLALLRDLRMPVVTTLHTVLREPQPDQRRVLDATRRTLGPRRRDVASGASSSCRRSTASPSRRST